ncbi:biotin--[acetyl-CoA-carboxylase] ligase [Atopobium deltae]|uniref:Biotin--[acetyl-CoA-carboxylase] ligase n=1 Tax=Atopobium deltae TaxID=1393034 RepID=A0A133XWR9_9ACTN|nr:hypothetical protein [Atopobium deltae]KXB35387.1 biotin--[acetyl-CoA-carboxylase] ligase [Atopobium deltae]
MELISSHGTLAGDLPIEFLSQVDSLPAVAKEVARQNPQAQTMFVSNLQTQGSARMGRLWQSASGCFHVVMIVRPQVPMPYFNGLSILCSLAVLDVFEQLGLTDIAPKWPNDFTHNGKKLGSVFVDAGYADGMFALCGVHLNLTRDPASPNELAKRIASTYDGTPHPFEPAFLGDCLEDCRVARDDAHSTSADINATLDIRRLAELLYQALAARVSAWEDAIQQKKSLAGPIALFLHEYYDRMDLLGAKVQALAPDGRVQQTGILAGLDVWGRITLLDEKGAEHEFAPEQTSIRAL